MDIQILLTLQQFRNTIGAPLISFFQKMTFLGELSTVLVIMAIVYWCVDKEFGNYLLMGWSGRNIHFMFSAGVLYRIYLSAFNVAECVAE